MSVIVKLLLFGDIIVITVTVESTLSLLRYWPWPRLPTLVLIHENVIPVFHLSSYLVLRKSICGDLKLVFNFMTSLDKWPFIWLEIMLPNCIFRSCSGTSSLSVVLSFVVQLFLELKIWHSVEAKLLLDAEVKKIWLILTRSHSALVSSFHMWVISLI